MAWDYPTNFSGGQNIDSLGSVFQYGSYITDGWLSYGALLVIFLMSFLGTAVINTRKALMGSTFITFIFSVYFMRLDILPIHTVIGIALVFVASLVLGAKEGSGGL